MKYGRDATGLWNNTKTAKALTPRFRAKVDYDRKPIRQLMGRISV
jgi:hypothetical protein